MRRMGYKGLVIIVSFIGCLLFFCGCGVQKQSREKVRSLQFAVLTDENIPEECKSVIEQKKDRPCQFTYEDGQYLYICVGYGRQQCGGYSISVNDLYLTENAVCVDTNLIGPPSAEERISAETYPFLVLKTEYLDENVVFD